MIWGESLFDHVPSGRAVLGGAPFNVAWHLRGLGENPLFLGRVGEDPWGDEILMAMQSWGLQTLGLQRDPQHPTGQVQVLLQGSQPSYEILPDQAYDFIDPHLALKTLTEVPGAALIYHGTLATRTPAARAALKMFWQQTSLPTFFDLNLRDPWWDFDWVEECLQQATWAKMNQEELRLISGNLETLDDLKTQAQMLRKRYNLNGLIVTLGAKGSLWITESGVFHQDPILVQRIVDTVGAGDGFCAVVIAGLLKGWDPQQILPVAAQFAAQICGIDGAIARDSRFYELVQARLLA